MGKRDNEISKEPVPPVRTLYDRRKHADSSSTSRIDVQPSHHLNWDMRLPLYICPCEGQYKGSPTKPRKFVPKSPELPLDAKLELPQESKVKSDSVSGKNDN